MGIFDKARDALQQHAETIDPLVDRIAEEADRRTGGKHSAHLDRGADLVQDKLRDQAGRNTTPEADRSA